jgi:hypothetical protein
MCFVINKALPTGMNIDSLMRYRSQDQVTTYVLPLVTASYDTSDQKGIPFGVEDLVNIQHA